MPKQTFTDYNDELKFQKERWDAKPALRALYTRWYARIAAEIPPLRPIVEIGSGCGNFKAFLPEAVATDYTHCGAWIDRVVDATQMPFSENEVGNFVLLDCLHHLQRPLQFLRDATKALQPGGRIVFWEPAATPWARFVYGRFHHEPLDLKQNLFAEDGTPPPADPGHTFTNMGIATLLFQHGLGETLQRVPELNMVRREWSDFLVYPSTGGFSYSNFMPAPLASPLYSIERVLTRPWASWLTGLRLLVVLEKKHVHHGVERRGTQCMTPARMPRP